MDVPEQMHGCSPLDQEAELRGYEASGFSLLLGAIKVHL